MIKTYYRLTKPGIIYANVLTAAAGFLLAASAIGHIDYWLLLATVTGTSLVIASACVVNNYIDRGIDAKMARTKRRALVSGRVSVRSAMAFAVILGLAGFLVLGLFTSWLVFGIGAAAYFTYIVLYGVSKRRSVHGTVVGSLAGSASITAGYCAASGRFDAAAAILFLILACWQMPHFYAIAIYRLDDYRAAGLPVLPAKCGLRAAKVQILLYILAFIVANCLLTGLGYTGYIYLVVMLAVGLAWLKLGWRGFGAADSRRWARRMFFFSLVVVMVLSLMLAVGGKQLLP